jgi:hypothetical protein
MEITPMSRLLAALLASVLMAVSQTALAADEKPVDFSGKGKSAEAKKKGQSDTSSAGSSSEAPRKKGQASEERRGATPAVPATPAEPGVSPAKPATPAVPPVK